MPGRTTWCHPSLPTICFLEPTCLIGCIFQYHCIFWGEARLMLLNPLGVVCLCWAVWVRESEVLSRLSSDVLPSLVHFDILLWKVRVTPMHQWSRTPCFGFKRGIVCKWLWWFRNSLMSVCICAAMFFFSYIYRPCHSVSMDSTSITHDLHAEGVHRHVGWSLAKGLGLYLHHGSGYTTTLFLDRQGSFKDSKTCQPHMVACLG